MNPRRGDFDSSNPVAGADPISEIRDLADQGLERLRMRLSGAQPDEQSGKTASAREIIERQEALLTRVMESASFLGHVVSIEGDQKDPKSSITVSCYGRLINVRPLPDVELKIGDLVKLAPHSSQIIGVAEDFGVGSICVVRRLIDDKYCEVDFNGSPRIVLCGGYEKSLLVDDRVILDSAGLLIVTRLGKADGAFKLGEIPKITWDDIRGLDDAKRNLIDMIESPMLYPELFKFYNVPEAKGAILYGPPGCGKTMLFEAIAASIARTHGPESFHSGFLLVKGPELLESLVGLGERKIRVLFMMGRQHFKRYGYPMTLVIDEADAFLQARGTGVSSDVNNSMVGTFLAEMNGVEASHVRVFLATNRIDIIDQAIIRAKRLDRVIYIPRPNMVAARAIVLANLKKHPTAGEIETLADATIAEFFNDKYSIFEVSVRKQSGEEGAGGGPDIETRRFRLADLVNGAMMADIVDKASLAALRRDVANGGESDASKRTGVTIDDLTQAVADLYVQRQGLKHTEELRDFVKDYSSDVVGIKRVYQMQEVIT